MGCTRGSATTRSRRRSFDDECAAWSKQEDLASCVCVAWCGKPGGSGWRVVDESFRIVNEPNAECRRVNQRLRQPMGTEHARHASFKECLGPKDHSPAALERSQRDGYIKFHFTFLIRRAKRVTRAKRDHLLHFVHIIHIHNELCDAAGPRPRPPRTTKRAVGFSSVCCCFFVLINKHFASLSLSRCIFSFSYFTVWKGRFYYVPGK